MAYELTLNSDLTFGMMVTGTRHVPLHVHRVRHEESQVIQVTADDQGRIITPPATQERLGLSRRMTSVSKAKKKASAL